MLASYPKGGACSIDIPHQNSSIKKNTDILVRGWAFDGVKKTVPDTVTLYLVNKESGNIKTFSAKRGPKREDVAKAFKNSALVDSGFDTTINLMQPGKYEMILLQADRDAGVISCAGESHNITVK